MPSYACVRCGAHFPRWTWCLEHLRATGHEGSQQTCLLRQKGGQGLVHTAQSASSISKPAMKKRRHDAPTEASKQPRSASLSDGAAFWNQLLEMEMASQEDQVQHRLQTWSSAALCQGGLMMQGLEARLHVHDRSLHLRCAENIRLPYNTFSLGDIAIVSRDELESVAVLAVGCVTSLSGSMLQVTLEGTAVPDPALVTPGRVFRVDKGFQKTPFDRMQVPLPLPYPYPYPYPTPTPIPNLNLCRPR